MLAVHSLPTSEVFRRTEMFPGGSPFGGAGFGKARQRPWQRLRGLYRGRGVTPWAYAPAANKFVLPICVQIENFCKNLVRSGGFVVK